MSSGSEICIWRPSLGTDNDLRGRKDKESERQENGRGKSSSPIPSPDSSSGRRGRSRTRAVARTRSSDALRRRGYHTLMSSFGKAFHVEKRWKLIREMGSGAYGYVMLVYSLPRTPDRHLGEPVAIKMVTRATEKVQLAKRALREITLLRHFNHENITGLIDVDCTPDLSEIYIFMEVPDLHQIIKSGQMLSNEHVQYFLYQVLRGMNLKPGNLLVNADCELKICDFGLSRGFNSKPDEEPTNMTEYVATRWYRAPEIMLAFKGYNTAIDVWSVGCIFGELMLGRPVFKGKDYDSRYVVMHEHLPDCDRATMCLGTPESDVVDRIASPKARAYIRSLPWKKRVPFSKVLPVADFQALDLLSKMLTTRHPWLASYHDITDEPDCPEPFERWRTLEAIETLEQYKEALYNEIQDYRGEVRSIPVEESEPEPELEPELDSELPRRPSALPSPTREIKRKLEEIREMAENLQPPGVDDAVFLATPEMAQSVFEGLEPPAKPEERLAEDDTPSTTKTHSEDEAARHRWGKHSGFSDAEGGLRRAGAIEDCRRRLLRTLSTVSIYESGEGFAGGLADIAPIGKYIVQERDEALPSEMPGELESPPKQDE
ncbi:kinase-like domain-containing protein [Fomitopsis serialis]|uniref:kinase-like domain-containing protein n=1 Tax=Fomitopsis serialis TaxID=139415 RepID=UPI002007C200|nr:kinase-like domain-containing protein [Neoantrodia serialis]KAH9915231.1 kinase-like domain-containing protein [Neoantrodia serialis]